MTQALLLSLFPAVAALAGGLLALKVELSKQNLVFALHPSAGVVLGAPLGHLALQGQPQIVEYVLLSFTAGMLVVVEGLIPEAHHLTRRQAGISALIFSTGFTSFAALSIYLP